MLVSLALLCVPAIWPQINQEMRSFVYGVLSLSCGYLQYGPEISQEMTSFVYWSLCGYRQYCSEISQEMMSFTYWSLSLSWGFLL